MIAEKFGGKWVFGGVTLLTGILTLLTPVAARLDYRALVALRVLMGMASGPAFPSAAVLWGKWVIKKKNTEFNENFYLILNRYHQQNVVLFHQQLKLVLVLV